MYQSSKIIRSTWTYIATANELLVRFRSDGGDLTSAGYEIQWECIDSLPVNSIWHVGCASAEIIPSTTNLIDHSCSSCECCGKRLIWERERCTTCADESTISKAIILMVTCSACGVVLIIVIMLRFGFKVITKYLSPLSVMANFYQIDFGVVTLGS